MLRGLPLAALGLCTTFAVCAQTLPTLGVYMDFDAAPGNSSLTVMQREVDALLKPTGISVNWRLVRENHGDETYSRLVVLKFTGNCQADHRGESVDSGDIAIVGDTKVVRGRVLPFSEVRCDQVRKALTFLAPSASKEQRQAALGRAMARVVAHELYHVLARTTSHAQHGLAKASQPLKDLISMNAITFREQDAEAIRRGFEDHGN